MKNFNLKTVDECKIVFNLLCDDEDDENDDDVEEILATWLFLWSFREWIVGSIWEEKGSDSGNT